MIQFIRVSARRHIVDGGNRSLGVTDSGGHSRTGLGRNGPEPVSVIRRRTQSTSSHLSIKSSKAILRLILLEIIDVHQNRAHCCCVHLAEVAGTQPQHAQAVGLRRRHGDRIGLAVGAVLRRNNEVHGAVGEVHHAVGRGNGGAGADGGGNGHLGQIHAIGQHKVIVAVLVQQGRAAVDGQACQVAGVVLQCLEAAAHRQILTFAVALLPRHAVQGLVGIAVQLVHELLSLHGGQGHGGGMVARVIVTDGGQDAHLLIVQTAQRLFVVAAAPHHADQVARHRLGFLCAILDGTGMVAVEHADLVRIAADIISNAHKAAHGGLADLDGSQVIAVLHDAFQHAHQTTGPLTGADGAVVGAADNNTQRGFRGTAIRTYLPHNTADRFTAGNGAIVAAADYHIAGRGYASCRITALSFKTGRVGVCGNVAVVDAVDQVFAAADNAAYHQVGDLSGFTDGIHLAIVGAVFHPTAAVIGDAAHIGAGRNGAALVHGQIFHHGICAQIAKQAKSVCGCVVIDEILDAIAVAVIGAVEIVDRRPVRHAGHVHIDGLLEEFALHVFALIDSYSQSSQGIQSIDLIGVSLCTRPLIGILFLRNIEEYIQGDRIAIHTVSRHQCQLLLCHILTGNILDCQRVRRCYCAVTVHFNRYIGKGKFRRRIHGPVECYTILGQIQRSCKCFITGA